MTSHVLRTLTICLGMILALMPAGAQPMDGWISHPQAAAEPGPLILHFRREIVLASVPARLPITITADNRFILFVNGHRIASGPSAGTVKRWRVRTLDLAPHLRRGHNVIAAAVWDFVRQAIMPDAPLPAASALPPQVAPVAQQSAGAGLRVTGSGISSAAPGWRVKIARGHTATDGRAQVPRGLYYVAGAPEIIDASQADWDWAGVQERGADWTDAVAVPVARPLIDDLLPAQSYTATDTGHVVRSDLAGADAFPARAIIVPANSHVRILLRRDAMIAAYPQLDVSGGRGARVRLTYAEALYDAARRKGDRDAVEDRQALGISDIFLPDGGHRVFAPLWWRVWRYAELDIQTADTPLTLHGFQAFETGYPFAQVGQFHSSDAELNRIWEVGWRTARIDAQETYMDSAYWEQLQYTGDTRLQMLISYAVSGDARLARQAIEAFAESNAEGGLQQGAYPSRSDNVIATFSLAWVGMLQDWSWHQADANVITQNLPRLRVVLDWFQPWLRPNGLLGRNPQWNFVDWVDRAYRDRFPSYGKDGGSCLMTALWLGALRQGAALEAAHGDAAKAAADTARADAARDAIRAHCWSRERGLFADNADLDLFSQHMNALAVLHDVATPDEARAVLDRITTPDHGIDAPEGMLTSSYYFSWYLVRAFEHAGLADHYPALLKTWRDLLALHYTTWPEMRGDTRSDSHAWSAHPTADLLGIVAGIRPAAPGYARLRVAPVLDGLTALDAAAATPHGPVRVRYRIENDSLTADITRPDALPGVFVWQGRTYPLTKPREHLVLPR